MLTQTGFCRTGLLQRAAALLCALACTLSPALAQTTLVAATGQVQPQSAATPTALHIDILEGEEALNNIRERNTREPIVQVEDQNHKPVAGALVLFTLHGGTSGAGGSVGGLSTFSTVTGADGKAQMHGLQLNQTPGNYTITVQATVGAVTAEATIHQSNVLNAANTSAGTETVGAVVRKSSVKRNVLFVGGAAIIVTTIAVLTRQRGTTITAGTGSVHP